MNKALARKIMVYLIASFIYAAGVTVVKVCYLGISPVTSVPYVLSLVAGQTLGMCTVYYNFVFYLIQKLVMKKEYTWRKFVTQFILSFVFAVMIDFTAVLFGGFVPQRYLIRLLYLIFGCFVLAAGMTGVVISDFGILPAEGAALCIQRMTKLEFGTCKIILDITSVAAAALISLVFLKRIEGVREGTLISAFAIGSFAKWIIRIAGPVLQKFLQADK